MHSRSLSVLTALTSNILCLLVLTPGLASAQSLQLDTPSFYGTGCNSSNARATLSPNGQQISILFDDYIVSAEGRFEPAIDRKNCDVNIPIRAPHGFSVALFTIDYRGFAALDSSSRLSFTADYSLSGRSSRRYSREFQGPMNDNYTFRNEIRAELDVWSACGGTLNLRTQSSMIAEAPAGGQAQGSIDSMDIQSGIIYSFQFRRCNTTPEPPRPTPTPTPPAHQDRNIKGNIDQFTTAPNGGVVLQGWACAKNTEQSIDVHVYVNGAAGGGGQMLKAGRASNSSEAAVSRECGTQNTAHRFAIPFTAEEALQFGNAPVWVHGISPVGLPNLAIANSGRINFPKASTQIFGSLVSVTDNGGGGNQVTGFACHASLVRPIEVEIFVGGPAGVGRWTSSAKANLGMDVWEMPRQCIHNANQSGFAIQIPPEIASSNIGQAVYAYAIDPLTGTLHQLSGSGSQRVIQPRDAP